MANDVNKKLGDILKGIDQQKITKSKETIEKLLKTPEGKKLQQQLGTVDRDQLIKNFLQMDTQTIQKKLNQADLSALSGLSAEDILKKLR